MRIKAPRDFWAGVMFAAIAAVAFVTARGYSLGTSTRMGPGYFPVALSFVLAALACILIVRSLVLTGDPVERLQLRPIGVLMLAIIAFGLMITNLGLVISLGTVTAFSAVAGTQFRLREVALLTLVVTLLSVAVFIYALRLPLAVWPTF